MRIGVTVVLPSLSAFVLVAGLVACPCPAVAAPGEYADSGVVEGRGVPSDFYLVVGGQDGVDPGRMVTDAGGRVLVSMPPDRVIASFANPADARPLAGDFRVRSISPLADSDGSWRVDERDRADLVSTRLALSKPLIETKKPPLVGDAVRRSVRFGEDVVLQAPVVPPDFIDVMPAVNPIDIPVLPAWPMKNTVAVSIIMPESDGSVDLNKETWTTDLEDAVYREITSGMAWWPAKASAYGIDLEFKFYSYRPSQQGSAVATGYEPITHESVDESLWIGDIMNNLGYTGYYTSAVDAFNTYMKNYAGADSAITVFVVNSKNDSNGEFPDGLFAYAHWGGPLIVMTTDNSSYGLSEMSNVIVHEMGHSFYAVDEYYSPGYATCSCDDGYNGCKNRNCAAGCGMNVPCMMRYNEDALCADTVCHIGWVCQCSVGECCDGCGYRPGSHICRKTTGGCDITEFCTGSSTSCPKDTFRAANYKCRSSAGDCDVVEYCNGSSAACPADVVKGDDTVCRVSGGDCDPAETCDGASGACPANVFLDSSHVCRESGGDCDAAEYCSGKSATCPADNVSGSGSICRESTGPCDAAEHCNVQTGECPADAFASSSTVCRASAGPCDAPEYCTGDSSDCPDDEIHRNDHECRPANGACDAAEKCDGKSASCPLDMIKGKGAECRAAAGACDAVEACDGKSTKCPADLIYGAGMMCREPAVDCDIAEFCTGTGVKCPPNAMWAPGHLCDDDDPFTSGDKCSAEGDCVGIEDSNWWGCSAGAGVMPSGPALAALFVLFAALVAMLAARRRSSGGSRV